MSVEISDNKNESRKGRPPIGGSAMTPAERKRRQRQKAEEAKVSDPSWLMYRKEILQYMFDRFPFSNVDELASALSAVSVGFTVANCLSKRNPSMAREALIAIGSPEVWEHGAMLPELLKHSPDQVMVSEGTQQRRLIELYCDIFESHENDEVHR